MSDVNKELEDRLQTYSDYYITHRDDDPEYGLPMSPVAALRKYFIECGEDKIAELLLEVSDCV